jgi:YVTN family beta-propeller protein
MIIPRRFLIAAPILSLAVTAACRRRPEVRAEPPKPTRVYVSNEDTGEVAVIDGLRNEVTGKIAVGKRPRGLRVSGDGRKLFVALSGSPKAPPGVHESKLPPADRSADGIGVVDLATGRLERTLQGGQDPEAIDVSKDGKLLFVSNEETAEMSVLDLASGQLLRRIKVGAEPEGVATHPDGRVVYVSCEADNHVAVVDTNRWEVTSTFQTAARPRSIVFTPDGARAFVTAENGGRVDVINAKLHRLMGSIELPKQDAEPMAPQPMGAVLSPRGDLLYVTNGRAASVSVIDISVPQEVRRFLGVGPRPWGIGVSADGRKLFTANGGSGDVSVVDTESGLVTQKLEIGGSPWGVAVVVVR